MSYPDLVEDGGKYFLTETQKDVARVHEIDGGLLNGMWNQFAGAKPGVTGGKVLVDAGAKGQKIAESVNLPALPNFTQRSRRGDYGTDDMRAGFTLDLWTKLATLAPGQTLLDNRTADGRGFTLRTLAGGAIEIAINDGRTECRAASDAGVLRAGVAQHIAVIVDGGPKVITFVIDGKLNDGGEQRQFGWTRFSPNLRSAAGEKTLRVAPEVQRLRIYGRYLRTSEAIANYRAGMSGAGAGWLPREILLPTGWLFGPVPASESTYESRPNLPSWRTR